MLVVLLGDSLPATDYTATRFDPVHLPLRTINMLKPSQEFPRSLPSKNFCDLTPIIVWKSVIQYGRAAKPKTGS